MTKQAARTRTTELTIRVPQNSTCLGVHKSCERVVAIHEGQARRTFVYVFAMRVLAARAKPVRNAASSYTMRNTYSVKHEAHAQSIITLEYGRHDRSANTTSADKANVILAQIKLV